MNGAPTKDVAPASSYPHQPPSLYVVPSFYDWLAGISADLARAVIRPAALTDRSVVDEIAALLTVEARLLDQAALQPEAYDHWLGLYDDECIYWIPSSQPADDPRKAVTLEFHDRRRLLDRVARLRTGKAYSQLPTSRTARLNGDLEVWPSPDRTDEWRARCTFVIAESREGRGRILAGWNGLVLRKSGGQLRIVVKQINLIDSDGPQGNNSFFL
jgi:3-phenylpropionate/cinnamic acid dioxygenase small subunit